MTKTSLTIIFAISAVLTNTASAENVYSGKNIQHYLADGYAIAGVAIDREENFEFGDSEAILVYTSLVKGSDHVQCWQNMMSNFTQIIEVCVEQQ